ncbi:MAG: hypothetical protein K2L07_05580 [Lachnospiraceae bacterium]|nr:hypothetical protein [Lachnospiraceae bacterium]
MRILMFVCFILAGIVSVSVIKTQAKKSHIGEEGRKTARSMGMRALAIGVLLFVGSGVGIIQGQILRRTDIGSGRNSLLYMVMGVGILLMGTGLMILKRMKLEEVAEIIVTTLSDCRIVNCQTRWLHYDTLIGVSSEGRQNMFTFFGKDREVIEQAQETGEMKFIIRYYENSGRIHEIVNCVDERAGHQFSSKIGDI